MGGPKEERDTFTFDIGTPIPPSLAADLVRHVAALVAVGPAMPLPRSIGTLAVHCPSNLGLQSGTGRCEWMAVTHLTAVHRVNQLGRLSQTATHFGNSSFNAAPCIGRNVFHKVGSL